VVSISTGANVSLPDRLPSFRELKIAFRDFAVSAPRCNLRERGGLVLAHENRLDFRNCRTSPVPTTAISRLFRRWIACRES